MSRLPHDRDHLKPRPTVYKGILMRSRLEGRTAQLLDSIPGIAWEYEPAGYADQTGDWLPDFVVRGYPCPLFIEVKGPPLDADGRAAVLRSMMRVWQSVPTAGLAIWSSRTLEGEPFTLIRPDTPPITVAIWRCPECACRWLIRPDRALATCRACAKAA
jgi:hypothetical protein